MGGVAGAAHPLNGGVGPARRWPPYSSAVPPVPSMPQPDPSPDPRTSGADPLVVGPYLAAVLGETAWTDSAVTRLAGGRSNLTYRVDSAAGSLVLRRPPLGTVLATAHDMAREHRVVAALRPTAVPVPRALHLCTDAAVLGAPFWVMSFVAGYAVTGAFPAGYAEDEAARRRVAAGLVDTLVALHAVDVAAVGLSDLGRPEGYLARQVRRWSRQWEATRLPGRDDVDVLAAALAAAIPDSGAPGIVHGDFRLDNTLLDPREPGRVAAVVDWEMATLGDPLADLGLLLVYWAEAGDEGARLRAGAGPSVTTLPGMPSRRELAGRYAEASGRDVAALPWYVALGCFKLAVVSAGIVARVRAGQTPGVEAAGYAERLAALVSLGQEVLGSDQVL